MKTQPTNKKTWGIYSSLAQETKFEDLPEYLQNCAKEYNIKHDTSEGMQQILYLGNLGLFINYIANIQFIIVKRNIETKTGKEITEDELYELISNINPTLIDKISSYSIDILTTEDISKIYEDFSVLLQMYKKNKIFCVDSGKLKSIINQIQKHNFKTFANKNSCINNIKTLKKLNDLGLQKYISKQMTRILGETINQEINEEFPNKYR